MSNSTENIFERLSHRRIKIGGWYFYGSQWFELILSISWMPIVCVWFTYLGIAAFCEVFGIDNFLESDGLRTTLWVCYWIYLTITVAAQIGIAQDMTKYTYMEIEEEKFMESEEYKMKKRHIEALRETIGDYEADRREKELLSRFNRRL